MLWERQAPPIPRRGGPACGLRRCAPSARPPHPKHISQREVGTATPGLAAARTWGRASGRRSPETSREGRGTAVVSAVVRAWPVLDGARGCGAPGAEAARSEGEPHPTL